MFCHSFTFKCKKVIHTTMSIFQCPCTSCLSHIYHSLACRTSGDPGPQLDQHRGAQFRRLVSTWSENFPKCLDSMWIHGMERHAPWDSRSSYHHGGCKASPRCVWKTGHRNPSMVHSLWVANPGQIGNNDWVILVICLYFHRRFLLIQIHKTNCSSEPHQ